MRYFKLTVSLAGTPKRVYREFYVSQNTSLYELGLTIIYSFNAVYEHMFYFEVDRRIVFEDESWVIDDRDEGFGERLYYDYKDVTINHLAKLGKKIVLIYDTGEGYELKCTIANDNEYFPGNERIILNKAKGYGIFEDSHELLRMFLSSDLEFEKVCDEYTDGSPWLPLGLEMPLNYTQDDYYKSYNKASLNELRDRIKSNLQATFDLEDDRF